ncbi:unnamed protein product [Pylaiella littoralis]
MFVRNLEFSHMTGNRIFYDFCDDVRICSERRKNRKKNGLVHRFGPSDRIEQKGHILVCCGFFLNLFHTVLAFKICRDSCPEVLFPSFDISQVKVQLLCAHAFH